MPNSLDLITNRPVIILYVCGEEASGKTYSINLLAEKFKKVNLETVVIDEDTTAFFDKDVKTYDEFCLLGPKERYARTTKVVGRNIEELQKVSKIALSPKVTEPILVLIDRPWWDGFYYSIKRSENNRRAKQELSFFDAMSFIACEDIPILPKGCVYCSFIFLNPLKSVLLKSDKKRPAKCVDSKFEIARAEEFVNYLSFAIASLGTHLLSNPSGYESLPLLSYIFESFLTKEAAILRPVEPLILNSIGGYQESLKVLKFLLSCIKNYAKNKKLREPFEECLLEMFTNSFECRNAFISRVGDQYIKAVKIMQNNLEIKEKNLHSSFDGVGTVNDKNKTYFQ